MILLALGGIAALLAGVVFLGWIERCSRDVRLGVATVLAIQVLDTFIDDGLPPIAPGGVTITLGDLGFVVVLVATAMTVLRRRRFAPLERVLLLLFGVLVWSLVRGAVTYGLTTAFNEARGPLYTYANALYVGFATLDARTRRDIGQLWLMAAWGLVAIAFFRWAAFFAGVPPVGIFSRVQEPGTLRVIDARTTLMLVVAIFMVAPRWLQGIARPSEKWLAVLATFSVLLLQHRTLWLVLLLAGAWFAWENPRIGGRVVTAVGSLAVVAVVLFVALAPSDTSEIEGVAQSPIESETVEWRIVGWDLLLSDQQVGFGGVVVGRPYGAGWYREIGYSQVTADPHNWYVQDYLRMGVVGLVLHLAALAMGWAQLRRSRASWLADRYLTPPVQHTWVVAYLLFGLLWSMNSIYGVVLGLLCARWLASDLEDRAGTALLDDAFDDASWEADDTLLDASVLDPWDPDADTVDDSTWEPLGRPGT